MCVDGIEKAKSRQITCVEIELAAVVESLFINRKNNTVRILPLYYVFAGFCLETNVRLFKTPQNINGRYIETY